MNDIRSKQSVINCLIEVQSDVSQIEVILVESLGHNHGVYKSCAPILEDMSEYLKTLIKKEARNRAQLKQFHTHDVDWTP